PRLADDRRDSALAVAFYVLERYLKLLHPIMPYITEEIWQRLPNKRGKSIMVSDWPKPDELSDPEAAEQFEMMSELISELREIRAEFKIPPKMEIEVVAKLPEAEKVKPMLDSKAELLSFLAKVSGVRYESEAPKMSASTVVHGIEFYVPLAGLIDVEKERARLLKEIEELKQLLEKTEKKLSNKNFIEKAPAHIVEAERQKAENFRTKIAKLEAHLARMR
ncbi:MAG: valine--tRNA ligase, partial [Candidatus Hydrothermota bacterium]